ncbi:MAG: transketolase [Anaerolineae bacterium]|jgi:transketolase
MNPDEEKRLRHIAVDLREDIVRIGHICEFGVHLGGTLSLAEILSVLYFHILRVKPDNPEWPERDRLVLSKGHGNLGLCAALARRGFFPLERLNQFNQLNSPFSMHADQERVSGVEVSAGALGHGLPIAVGMALSSRVEGASWRTCCILSDGEMMEGSSWEAMMAAAHYDLDSLTAIIDRNRLSLDGHTKDVMTLEPLAEKCRAFGWTTLEVDGHDVAALANALSPEAGKEGRPKMVIANTVKGSGVSFLEDRASSHFGHLTAQEAQQAQAELEEMRARIV